METKELLSGARDYVNKLLAEEVRRSFLGRDAELMDRLERIIRDIDWLIGMSHSRAGNKSTVD